METLAMAGGVIAVLSLAGQVLQGCNYLQAVLNNAKEAPVEICMLLAELAVIEKIVRVTPDDSGYRDALDFCNEAVSKLRLVVDRYGERDNISNRRKWCGRLRMALNVDKIQKHLGRLREARGHLQHVHNQSAHSRNTETLNNVLQSIADLQTSYHVSAVTINDTQRKIDEMHKITSHTQLTINKLANQFLHRQDQARLCSDKGLSQIEVMLRGLFIEHDMNLKSTLQIEAPVNTSLLTDTLSSTASNPQALHLQTPAIAHPQDQGPYEVDSDISEVMYSSNWDDQFETQNGTSKEEKTSKYVSSIGEVYMRTVSITYESAKDLLRGGLYENASTQDSTRFPLNITKTDIILLPRQWNRTRGAYIAFELLPEPFVARVDATFQFRKYGGFGSSSKDGKMLRHRSFVRPRGADKGDIRQISTTKSSLLLQAALSSTSLMKKGKTSPLVKCSKPLKMTVIPRKSFDDEINDCLELVNLWLHSDFDADLQRFSQKGTKGAKLRHLSSAENSPRVHGQLQELRLMYLHDLITTTSSTINTGDWKNGSCLDRCHHDSWRKIQNLILSSNISWRIMDSSFSYVHVHDRSYARIECLQSLISSMTSNGKTVYLNVTNARLQYEFRLYLQVVKVPGPPYCRAKRLTKVKGIYVTSDVNCSHLFIIVPHSLPSTEKLDELGRKMLLISNGSHSGPVTSLLDWFLLSYYKDGGLSRLQHFTNLTLRVASLNRLVSYGILNLYDNSYDLLHYTDGTPIAINEESRRYMPATMHDQLRLLAAKGLKQAEFQTFAEVDNLHGIISSGKNGRIIVGLCVLRLMFLYRDQIIHDRIRLGLPRSGQHHRTRLEKATLIYKRLTAVYGRLCYENTPLNMNWVPEDTKTPTSDDMNLLRMFLKLQPAFKQFCDERLLPEIDSVLEEIIIDNPKIKY